MSDYVIQGQTLAAIGDAIREKTGASEAMTPAEMADAIGDIQTGEEAVNALRGLIDRMITEIDLPEDLTAIGEYAFYKCAGLSIGKLPDGITSIGSNAFYGCSVLALTELPNGLTSLGDGAFNYCGRLALTGLPSGVTTIGNYLFRGCYRLALTELPAEITNIGSFAFYNCTSLTEMTFRGTPQRMEANCFSKCESLLTIRVPWSEGEVAGAPWGATNATIIYNYTEG